MTKDVGILILGLIVAAMPFLGFPVRIENILYVVSGLLIALLAFLIRGDFSLLRIERTGDTFVENGRDYSKPMPDGVVAGKESGHEKETADANKE